MQTAAEKARGVGLKSLAAAPDPSRYSLFQSAISDL